MTPDQRLLLHYAVQNGVVGEWQTDGNRYIRRWLLLPRGYEHYRDSHCVPDEEEDIAATVHHETFDDGTSTWVFETALDCDDRDTLSEAQRVADCCLPNDALPASALPAGWEDLLKETT